MVDFAFISQVVCVTGSAYSSDMVTNDAIMFITFELFFIADKDDDFAGSQVQNRSSSLERDPWTDQY